METFSRYWLFVKAMHRSPVDFPHKGKWPGALMFSFSSAPEQTVEQTLETPVFFMPLRSLWRHCTGHLLCGNHKGPVMRKMFPFDDVIMIMLAWFLIPTQKPCNTLRAFSVRCLEAMFQPYYVAWGHYCIWYNHMWSYITTWKLLIYVPKQLCVNVVSSLLLEYKQIPWWHGNV